MRDPGHGTHRAPRDVADTVDIHFATVRIAAELSKALTLRAIVIGIGAVIGAIIAGSVVGYKVVLHCDFSCALFQ